MNGFMHVLDLVVLGLLAIAVVRLAVTKIIFWNKPDPQRRVMGATITVVVAFILLVLFAIV